MLRLLTSGSSVCLSGCMTWECVRSLTCMWLRSCLLALCTFFSLWCSHLQQRARCVLRTGAKCMRWHNETIRRNGWFSRMACARNTVSANVWADFVFHFPANESQEMNCYFLPTYLIFTNGDICAHLYVDWENEIWSLVIASDPCGDAL